ncbi:MAG: hypothetical protein WKG00_07715 [Polyangiaceae bacterium]
MSNKAIIERITRATSEIEVAEKDLRRVMSELEVIPRAEKTVSETVQKAFEELHAARARLVELHSKLTKDED